MHNIKYIRNNPKQFEKLMKRRGISLNSSEILDIDNDIRSYQTKMQVLQEKRNKASKDIGILISQGADISSLKKNISDYKSDLTIMDEKVKDLNLKLNNLLIELPNSLEDDVPEGKSEEENQFIKAWGEKPQFSFNPLDHVEIGEKLNQMDFKRGVKISGSRFVLLRGQLALLERALSTFMIETHLNDDEFEEISPPFLVKEHALFGTGQLPKFSDDLFHTTDNRWLIPTAEVPLTNIVSNEIIDKNNLPLRFVANTPCFRSEAGAAGSDTRGMIRQHQFSKVEMVFVTHPTKSNEELEYLVSCAEKILQKLKLPYRVMMLCSGDVGFSAKKTYDLEVWLPGQNSGQGLYREISSCSNCGDFQARRMNAKFKDKVSNEIDFLHTLNGSGLAVGRTMIAILENYQQKDGSIVIPDALLPYMRGLKKIEMPH
ncbi:serine--tRNA ligase [Alphaproteobacteria bacterium]|jgi:seryl-tRNA synthetase|nr:serine--tRNA ligase [Alphaproteobacteria bacterium]MDB2583776.1 serine--tRNA ligase [Alphaproteobacteria bacterium]MDC0969685.1 serine--tRNA ligase [Alphaproteobacteria bacterium]MDC6453516.1 serine--tRNA ligase [Alphaproteobacteria bacterium]